MWDVTTTSRLEKKDEWIDGWLNGWMDGRKRHTAKRHYIRPTTKPNQTMNNMRISEYVCIYPKRSSWSSRGRGRLSVATIEGGECVFFLSPNDLLGMADMGHGGFMFYGPK